MHARATRVRVCVCVRMCECVRVWIVFNECVFHGKDTNTSSVLLRAPPSQRATQTKPCGATSLMELDIAEWFWELPPVTRGYLVLSFLLTAACALDFVSLFSLYFNYQLIMKGEVGLLRGGLHSRDFWHFPGV